MLAMLCLVLCACENEPRLGLGEERVPADEQQTALELWESIANTMRARAADGDGIMRRFNQAKSLGCFDATFTVTAGLPPRLAQGVFARPDTYPALVRFAAASESDDRNKDIYGFSIAVQEIDTLVTLNGGSRQDFVLNSHPALFAADPEDFAAFADAVENDRMWAFFVNPLDPHPGALLLLLRARSNPENPFALRYFSTTPFRHGDDAATAVKYAAAPCAPIPAVVSTDHEHRLRDAMASHLEQAPACFDFLVQFQTDPETMPIEDASVEWPEEQSPFLTVARIQIPRQEFRTEAAMASCETLAFNPWNAHRAHRPLGGINRVRKMIYTNAAQLRNTANSN